MTTGEKPKLTFLDFGRDLESGDSGQDVANLQKILIYYGFKIDASEMSEADPSKAKFGASTAKAASQMRDHAAKNPGIVGEELVRIVLQHVFQIDPDELNESFFRGQGNKIRNYRNANKSQLEGLEAVIGCADHSVPQAIKLASQFLGQRETGTNRGALVKKFCGYEGVTWCGGFVNYVMDHSIAPGLYNQVNPLGALSYRDEATKYGAFHKKSDHAYEVQPGDVVVFTRGGGGKGHVGIVSNITEDGTVTYISGNDGNAVRSREFNIKNPPKGLIGYSSTAELAAAKGIALNTGTKEENRDAALASVAFARGHKQSTYIRG